MSDAARVLPDHSAAIAELVGMPTGPVALAPDVVNTSMIRHWVEAMGDADPVYVTDDAARAAGLDGVIAPPTMLQAWTMRGLRATLELEAARAAHSAPTDSPLDRLTALIDEEGMTSVVATNCDQDYARPLVPGDRLLSASVIESVSAVKETALGTGRFITTRTDFVAVPDDSVALGPDGSIAPDPDSLFAAGDPVATMRFRILRFRPKAAGPGTTSAAGQGAPASPRRPRPPITEDNAFWFEAARGHRLLIQRCTSCGALRHPPLPACPRCRSFEWDTVEASGRATVFSFVVTHYPQVPGFDYPLAIGLVELEEGTRLVADLGGIDTATWQVGMAVQARFVDFDDELSLPVFHPADAAGADGAGED